MNYSSINGLIGSLVMNCDYLNYCINKKIIIVEGKTDKDFLNKIMVEYNVNDVKFVIANKAFVSNDLTINSCKKAMVELIHSLDKFGSLINIPNCLKVNTLYGLVDRDYGIIEPYKNLKNLIYNDTHDLETMLISTDNNIFDKISDYKFSENDICVSYKISYQLGLVKDSLIKNRTDLYGALIDLNYLSLSKIIKNKNLDISEYIKLLNNSPRNEISINKKTIEQIISRVKKDIKSFYKNDTWDFESYDFKTRFPQDFWEITNGHDICTFLVIKSHANEDHEELDKNLNVYRIQLEESILSVYDICNFEKSLMYKKLIDLKIIKE